MTREEILHRTDFLLELWRNDGNVDDFELVDYAEDFHELLRSVKDFLEALCPAGKVLLNGPFNEHFCNNPHADEVCRHIDPQDCYKCMKYSADLAMQAVDPTPETFFPAAVRCEECLLEKEGD